MSHGQDGHDDEDDCGEEDASDEKTKSEMFRCVWCCTARTNESINRTKTFCFFLDLETMTQDEQSTYFSVLPDCALKAVMLTNVFYESLLP